MCAQEAKRHTCTQTQTQIQARKHGEAEAGQWCSAPTFLKAVRFHHVTAARNVAGCKVDDIWAGSNLAEVEAMPLFAKRFKRMDEPLSVTRHLSRVHVLAQLLSRQGPVRGVE